MPSVQPSRVDGTADVIRLRDEIYLQIKQTSKTMDGQTDGVDGFQSVGRSVGRLSVHGTITSEKDGRPTMNVVAAADARIRRLKFCG
jgi:hypothetical protein